MNAISNSDSVKPSRASGLLLAALLVAAGGLAGCSSAMFPGNGPAANTVPRELNLNPGTVGMDCAVDMDGNPVDVGTDVKC